jgi:glycosyltransferase involved in cell wall biosynthesis
LSAVALQRSPRIALLTPMLPLPHDTTRGRYIYEIARCLSRITPTRVFFQQQRYPTWKALQPRSFSYDIVGSDYRIDGLDTETFNYPALPILSRPINSWVSARTLIPRLRSFAPDVLLAYWIVPDGHAATLAARALSIPVVVGALGSDVYLRDSFNAWLTRRTLNAASSVIAVAKQMQRSIIERYGVPSDRVHAVVNGFNTAVFQPRPQPQARAQLGVASDARVILFVGRLMAAKGLRELMQAFASLASRERRYQLVMVGQGPMQAELLQASLAAGLAARVRLTGGLQPLEVAQWIAAADVLTLPSWSEGYPNVLVEALACGRPVVATDVGGTREIVSESSGLLVAPRDAEALAAALEAALQRSWDRAAIAASVRRSWDDVARDTLAICLQSANHHSLRAH